jgi:hypothetical protein
MQPNTKKRRTGGTDSSKLRRRRSATKGRVVRASAMDSFESDPGYSASSTMVEAEVLPSLVVMPKRNRGPVVPTEARRFGSSRWDGQRPVPTIQSSPSYIAHLQAIIDATGEELNRTRERHGAEGRATLAVLERIRREKGDLKSALKKKEREDDRNAIMSEASSMLHCVVRNAQLNCGAWLGSSRFGRWAKGEWLPV